ncbi:hypothetical protein M3N64_13340 [Sporolactobacillus sp. CPB3-1]|uniref:Uncharacterized protein n=1 Tax=Sporolactobacillus mangiferae TaxID=2940498 RepID=A0ABT0MDF6_9BACL|nr:hypothetical protein [Sporolactobacillus mangiferae]MCL1632904.1 hypothetical protein [Sporolactobacillus mangiferae]
MFRKTGPYFRTNRRFSCSLATGAPRASSGKLESAGSRWHLISRNVPLAPVRFPFFRKPQIDSNV